MILGYNVIDRRKLNEMKRIMNQMVLSPHEKFALAENLAKTLDKAGKPNRLVIGFKRGSTKIRLNSSSASQLRSNTP